MPSTSRRPFSCHRLNYYNPADKPRLLDIHGIEDEYGRRRTVSISQYKTADLFRELAAQVVKEMPNNGMFARGREGSLRSEFADIEAHFWRYADLFSAPLPKCQITFAGKVWYDVQILPSAVARTKGIDRNPKSAGRAGRKPGVAPKTKVAREIAFEIFAKDETLPGDSIEAQAAIFKQINARLVKRQLGPGQYFTKLSKSAFYAKIGIWLSEFNAEKGKKNQ